MHILSFFIFTLLRRKMGHHMRGDAAKSPSKTQTKQTEIALILTL